MTVVLSDRSDLTLDASAGLSVFELARYMGTSVEMIDATYGHLAAGTERAARERLDAFVL